MSGGCSKCSIGQHAKKGVYVCDCRVSIQICRNCTEYWGKKCPFCGREMNFVSDAVFENQDRDQKRCGV